MLDTYNQAKLLIPKLHMHASNDYIEFRFGELKMFSASGPDCHKECKIYLSGLIAGYTVKIKKQ